MGLTRFLRFILIGEERCGRAFETSDPDILFRAPDYRSKSVLSAGVSLDARDSGDDPFANFILKI